MSYAKIQSKLRDRAPTFAQDVFDYLAKTGRAISGRAYFGTLVVNNPNLVSRLEKGKLPSLETMLKVWAYMEENPPPEEAEASK